MTDPERSIRSNYREVEGYLFRQRAMLVFVWSFLGGVFVSSFIFISPLLTLFFLVVALAICLAEKIWKGAMDREALLLAIAILAFALGAFAYSVKDFHEAVLPEPSGIVVSELEERENNTRFIMLSDNGEKVLVSTNLYSSVLYGDRVEVSGKLERPGMIDDGSGRPFDYAKFLSKDEIYFTISFAEVEVVSSGHGNPLKSALFKIKRSFVSKAKEVFPEPQASLVSGLLVAGKDAMPQKILDEFRRAGIIHIVVLSGYNITIIAEFLRRIFAKLWSLRAASAASIAAIFLFVLMTGGEPTVTRAALMVLVVIFARSLGKPYSAPRALLGAGFVMVLLNPKILAFDPSFQLSFLATLGLVYLAPILEKYLSKVTEKFDLRATLATTIATQITVLPYLIFSMGEVSLVALPANLLILLLIPYTMLLGFMATLVGYLGVILALPLSLAAHVFLSWILFVSSFLGNLEFSSISLPQVSFLLVALVYLLGIIALWRWRDFLQPDPS